MSDVKRIKTPWAYHYDDNGFFYIDGDEFVSPYIVATGGESDSDEANAKFIVEACNSYADAQATVETLQAQVKTARHDAVRAFVRGEDKMCLVCGAKEPCELKDDPSSPCTFDPTPMELKQQVEALQRELESANALLHKKNCAIGKAETTIEALQRERDKYARMWRDGCNDRGEAHKEIEELTAALDAEREKVKGLHEVTKVICAHCCEPMEIPSKAVLQTQLSQLQALVRAAASAPGKDWLEWQLKLGEALDGICPKDRALANDANREMGLPDDEDWGDK